MRADLHEIAALLVFLVIAVNACTLAVLGSHRIALNMAAGAIAGVAIVVTAAALGAVS